MEHLVVAPGSRSAPLAYAAAAAQASGALRTHVRVDERDAAFTALGISRSTGRPVAVLTTSGTAVGNLVPAMMEASHAGVPLVALTADRPPELRGTGANQTTRQPGLFANFVRAQSDILPATNPAADAAYDDVVRAVGRLLDAAAGDSCTAAGPVHLNVGLRDPLYPWAEEDHVFLKSWAEELAKSAASDRRGPMAHPWSVFDEPFIHEDLQGPPAPAVTAPDGVRAVVVAGDGAGPSTASFAVAAGLPLLAEPSSNARFGKAAIHSYLNVLEVDLAWHVDTVVLVGRPTLSRQVAGLLNRSDVRVVAVRPGPEAWFDEGHRHEETVASFEEAMDLLGPVREGWFETWEAAGAAASEALRRESSTGTTLAGVHVAYAVWHACMRDGAVLVAGSSNSIRDLDLGAWPEDPVPVVANRGVAGIDGTVATAHGVALGTGRPVRALLGDLTFLHDVGGLLLGTEEEVPDLHIVVLNDSGGGIFTTLEHGKVSLDRRYTETVERFFGTPHRTSLSELCAAYGVEYQCAESDFELAAMCAAPIRGRRVTEVPVDRHGLREFQRAIGDAAQKAARGHRL